MKPYIRIEPPCLEGLYNLRCVEHLHPLALPYTCIDQKNIPGLPGAGPGRPSSRFRPRARFIIVDFNFCFCVWRRLRHRGWFRASAPSRSEIQIVWFVAALAPFLIYSRVCVCVMAHFCIFKPYTYPRSFIEVNIARIEFGDI